MNIPFGRTLHGQDGQVLITVAFLLTALLGAAAVSIDIGFIMHAQRELQASADAAATAGALDLSNNLAATSAAATANSYSGLSGSQNAYNDLKGVTMVSGYPTGKCLTTTGVCSSCPCSNASGYNAMAVKEQVTVSTFFAKVFGVRSLTLTATSLASIKGSHRRPPT